MISARLALTALFLIALGVAHAASPELPDDAPLPYARVPSPAGSPLPTARPNDPPQTTGPAGPSSEELACRVRLRELGARFTSVEPLADPQGCAVPFPISVSSLSADIKLDPPATMNCLMAESLARFASEHIDPAAQSRFRARVRSIGQASAYVCRPRNGTTKLSEHALGNALDISTFTLSDGQVLAIGSAPRTEPEIDLFFSDIRKAACGPFTTVLGPGSDADHADHLHLDLQSRRNGSLFCE